MKRAVVERVARRRQRDKAPRDEILAAAADLFMDKGYHASSVREIGDSLGISQSSLYYHARSKLQILVDLNERFMGRLLAAMEAIAADEAPPATKVRAIVTELISTISQDPAEVTVVLHERRSLPPRQLRHIQKSRDRIDQIIDEIIREGIDGGDFRAVDVRLTRLALTGMCNWAYTWYQSGGRLKPQEIADHFANVFLNGIAKGKR